MCLNNVAAHGLKYTLHAYKKQVFVDHYHLCNAGTLMIVNDIFFSMAYVQFMF